MTQAAASDRGSPGPPDSRSPAVTRAVGLLEELARSQRPLSLTELARALGLAKSTVANLCSALEGSHMIRRIDGRWTLAYKVLELGQGFLSGTDLVNEFRRSAATLPVASRETLLLAILEHLDVVYLARHDGSQPIKLASDIGQRLPAVVTALGKAMLATLPSEELDRRLETMGELPVFTPRSHRSMDALRRDLDSTRERGYAVDDEQNIEGVTCIGVALPGRRDTPIAVSVTLLTARLTTGLRESLVHDLTTAARELSRLAAL